MCDVGLPLVEKPPQVAAFLGLTEATPGAAVV